MQKEVIHRQPFLASTAERSRKSPLLITITISITKSIHKLTELDITGDETERNHIVQSHLGTRGTVAQSGSTLDDELTTVDIQVLPCGPDVVDHTVMKEE